MQWPFNSTASNIMSYCSLVCNFMQWFKQGYIYYFSFQILEFTKLFILPERRNNRVLHIECLTSSMKSYGGQMEKVHCESRNAS